MKKVLWFMVLMIIGTNFILANEIIYSDYKEFGPYSEEYIESNELVDVQKEERYLWYKEEKVIGDYKLYDGNDSFILDDCYDTEYSNWSTNYEEKVGRKYEVRTVYNYELSKPIRYIHLTNLYGSYGAFRMPELIVKVNGEKINYAYTCIGCQSGFSKYINNGIYAENESYINNGGTLIIDLRKEYPAQNVEVIFYIFDIADDDKKYTISYSNDMTNLYVSKDYVYKFKDWYWGDSRMFSHNIKDLGVDKSLWTTNETSYSPLQSEYILSENSYNEYRYKDTYCRTYTLNKIYSDIYTKDSNNDFNIKDETKSKVYYSYRTRDKLELKDNLIINTYDYNLEDFIISSSTDFEIISDININKNGTYNITFKSDTMEVKKIVEVDILENDVKAYKEEINLLNNKIKDLELKYKTDIEEKDSIINNLKSELKECKENCEEKVSCLEKVIENKNNIIEQYKKENEDLINQIELLNNQIKVLEQNLNISNETISNLNEEINKLKNDLNNKQQELNKLLEENNILKKTIQELKSINKDYINQIDKLEKINNEYSEKIKELEDKVNKLNNEISSLFKEDSAKIEEINNLNKLINQYQNEINRLKEETYNTNELIKKLKQTSKDEIYSITQQLNEVIKEKELYYETILKLEINIEELNNIIQDLKNEKENSDIKYKEKIIYLENLNTEYLNKIQELENNIHNTNKSISDTINIKDEIIKQYEEEIQILKQDNIDSVETLNKTIEEKNKENISLNEKLNNYMLKINGEEKFNLFWIYILLLILLITYIIMRKKSIKK